MKVVALISTKGGTGKSTLAQALAVEAAKEGAISILDLDPQQSLAAWWRARQAPSNPRLVTGFQRIGPALKWLRDKGKGADWLVVDTPGSFMDVIGEAIAQADALIVVAQASGKDLQAQRAALDEITERGKAERAICVINRATPKSIIARDAAAFIAPRSAIPPILISDRVDYIKADLQGKAGNEMNKEAAKEIAALWKAVKEVAG